MIELELTQRQIKKLRKHFDVVLACFMMKERGMLVGQVRRRWDGKTAFMHIGFVPSQHCEPLVCMGTPRVPNCWAGIPRHTALTGAEVKTFIFNFKKEFAPAVESGAKCQTVRAIRKDGRVPVVGDLAKGYTGLRTRATRLLVSSPIVEVGRVLIDFRESTIALGGGRLTAFEAAEFARADGFESFLAMLAWFRSTHQEDPDYFEGFYAKWHSGVTKP